MNSSWPLFDPRIATPALTLQYPTDEHAERLAQMAADIRRQDGLGWWWGEAAGGSAGIADFKTRALQNLWEWRAAWRVDGWNLPLMATAGNLIVGVVEVYAAKFLVTKSVELGLWVDPALQAHGYGTEMAAVGLHVAFECLQADEALWSATFDNEGSLKVAGAVGFVANGGKRVAVETTLLDEEVLKITRSQWIARRRNDIEVRHFESCKGFFGLKT